MKELMSRYRSCLNRGILWSFIGVFLCLLSIRVTLAQDLKVEIPNAVYVGQPFRIVFVASGKVDEFKPPVWGVLKLLQGPMESKVEQIQMVNGRVSRSLRISFTYICQINEAGEYNLSAATAQIDGKTVKSEPITIEVLSEPQGGGGGANSQMSQSARSRGNIANNSSDQGEDLLVVIQLSQNEVYQGQPVVATCKVLTRLDLVSFEDFRFPDFKGFWAKEIETPQQISFRSEVYNGRQYNAGILRQYVLYPQKSGELEIEPLKAVVQYRVRGARQSFFDEFMGTFQTDTQTLISAARKLKVNALPGGAPSSFNGAVGNFSIAAKVDNQKVKTNDALSYVLTVSGAGNLQLLQKPELTLPSTVEVFPPKIVENYSIRNGIQTGSVAYEFIFIPRAPGELTIPPYEFSYFDPQAKAYKTISTSAFTLDIEADTTQRISSIAGSVSKEDVQYLGQDIRHIYVGNILLQPMGIAFVGSFFWWIALSLILLSFLCLWVVFQRRQAFLANLTLVRGKRAGNIARKRLQRAKHYMTVDAALFYVELERAIWGYFSDKFALELSSLSSDGVRTALLEKGVQEVQIEAVQRIISACEYARYAPASVEDDLMEMYNTTLSTLGELERCLKAKE